MNVKAELLNKCQANDRKAQYNLYQECFPILMNVCMRYLTSRNEAKSILNEGFLKILLNLKKYKENTPFEAWIRRIMINVIIDDFRKNKNYREKHDQVEDAQELENLNYKIPIKEADKLFDSEDIQQFIKALPDESRRVFNLFAIDGFSHKEIAEMMNIKEGTSKWHVSFARKQIQQKMHDYTKNKKND